MSDNGNPKLYSAVTIEPGNSEGRIEKLLTADPEQAKIRISCWSQGHLQSGPLDISEKDFVTLIYRAVRAGILSPEFLNNLHEEFEI